MNYTFGNLALSEDRAERSPEAVSLRADRTGRPIFILPTSRVSRPEIREVLSAQSLSRIGREPLTALDGANEETLKLFFQSGGQRALVYYIPIRSDGAVSIEEEIRNCFLNAGAGFRRRSGISGLLDHQGCGDIVLAPTLPLFCSPDTLRELNQQLLDMVSESEEYFGIVDAPVDTEMHHDVESLAAFARKLTSSRGSLYAGRITPRGNGFILPLSPLAAAVYQRNDQERSIEYTPANLPIDLTGYHVEALSEETLLGLEQMDVNTVRVFSEKDARLWGGRTLSRAGDYTRFIGCVRFMTALKNTLEDLLAPFVWNAATELERKMAETAVSSFFDQYYDPARRARSLDIGPKPKYSVTVETTTSKEKYFKLDLSVFLTIPMNWVDIQMAFEG